MKPCHVLQFILRLTFVLSVWLLIIPFITFWIWRLAFVRSFGKAQRLFLSHLSTTVILTDCLHGFLPSAIVFICLGATLWRDYFRHLWELGGQDADREDDGDRNGARAARRNPAQGNRNIPVDGNGEDAGGGQGIAGAGQMIQRNAENLAAWLEMQVAWAERQEMQAARLEMWDATLEMEAGSQEFRLKMQEVRLKSQAARLEIQEVRLEMQAALLEPQVEHMFLVDADGAEAQVEHMFLVDADGAEDVPFVELIGMQGPVFHLVENAFTILASNMIFLAVVIFVPFSWGRAIVHYLSWILSSATNPGLSTVVPLTDSTFSLANITLKNALTTVVNLTSDTDDDSWLSKVTEILKANAMGQTLLSNISFTMASDMLKVQSVGVSPLSDVTTLAVGYVFIFSLVMFYLGIVTLICYSRGEPLTMGRFYGIASIAETFPSLLRQFVAAMRHLMTMIKVAFLLVIELAVFPLMYGWWLDICTIRMLGKSISQRVEFFSVSPLASSLVHWVVGIIYALQISIFVRLLRGVLRNGVLYFLRFPDDPNYNLFRDLIDDPVHKHVCKTWPTAVYGSLIVILVFLPVKIAMRMVPSIFPLDISVSDPFTEIPVNMLLFQICIPFALEHFKLGDTLESLLLYWLTAVGWALGLTDFLLPKPEDNGGHENGNANLGRHDRGYEQAVGHERVAALEDGNQPRHLAANDNSTEDIDGDELDDQEWTFVLRIVLLFVVAWMTLLVFNSALIIVPIPLGRTLFNALPLLPVTHGIRCNDIYAFVIGSSVIWTGLTGARYCVELIRTRRSRLLLNQIWKWCGIVVKSCTLLSIWMIVIPVLIGLLFELVVIVPMRVPVDESPVFLLYQNWALGLIFLKIWTRMVMRDHMMVDERWRAKFERVREGGFSGVQGVYVMREIVIPIMMKLLTALCVPYVLSRGVFPIFGYPLVVNSAVYRFAWLGCLVLSVVYLCATRFHFWFTNLHNSIRDDRYLIGLRLHNYGEAELVAMPMASVEDEGGLILGR